MQTGTSTSSPASALSSREGGSLWHLGNWKSRWSACEVYALPLPSGYRPQAKERVRKSCWRSRSIPLTATPRRSLPRLPQRRSERTVGFGVETLVVLAPRSIPRTANGKIRYQELRRMLADGDLDREGAILFTMRRSSC